MRKPYTWNLVLKLLGGLACALFVAGVLLGDFVNAHRK